MFATDARKKHAIRIDIPCIRGKKIQNDALPTSNRSGPVDATLPPERSGRDDCAFASASAKACATVSSSSRFGRARQAGIRYDLIPMA